MRPSQKLALSHAIATELQQRYGFDDISAYLAEHKLQATAHQDYFEDAVDWAKSALRKADAATLLSISEDLEINSAVFRSSVPPKNWPDSSKYRLFISHLAKHKLYGTRLRDCLLPFHISGFVAHQDVHPTAEWQIEIERALSTMDAFLAIHTVGFKDSYWAQQEVGFAVARRVKIISFRMGEDPVGFISKQQALPHEKRMAEDIAKEINALLMDDPATSTRLAQVIELNTPKKRSFDIDDEIPF